MRYSLEEARKLIYSLETVEEEFLQQLGQDQIERLQFINTALWILTAAEDTEQAGLEINYHNLVKSYAIDLVKLSLPLPDQDVKDLIPLMIEEKLLNQVNDILSITHFGYQLLSFQKEAKYQVGQIDNELKH